jgi:SM-20-related protein
LPDASVRSLREDLLERRAGGRFHSAGVGKGRERRADESVRRDEICWLERDDGAPELWQALESLREALNRELYLGLEGFEGHYAAYPAGGFYRRHRDTFRADDERRVSLVLYLNAAWAEADGGRLRVYDGSPSGHTDIAPLGGTLVAFLSRELEHEVLPSRSERLSFTGWFKVRGVGRSNR